MKLLDPLQNLHRRGTCNLTSSSMTEISSSVSPSPCNSDPHHLSLPAVVIKRGPRFGEYSALREKRLRMKSNQPPRPQIAQVEEKYTSRSILAPPKWGQNLGTPPSRRSDSKCPSPLTQSVPDFTSVLRKENRKPVKMLLPSLSQKSLTPPLGPSANALYGKKIVVAGSSSKSAGKSLTTRKSCATMQEFRGLSLAAARAISGER